MEVCWVQDKSVVSQGTRQCAVFAVSCDMGEILQHFSKDMSAVYFWPLSTAQGDPRGWIANCFHTVIRAPSCRNMLQSFFPPPQYNSGWHGSFDLSPLHAPLQNGDELSLSSSDKKRSACWPSDCITIPSSGHSCVHTSCLTAGSPSLPWPFAVMLLFSYLSFVFFFLQRNLGQLGWDAVLLRFRFTMFQ